MPYDLRLAALSQSYFEAPIRLNISYAVKNRVHEHLTEPVFTPFVEILPCMKMIDINLTYSILIE